MKKFFGLFLFLATLVACDKDKFETKPQLKIKSVNKKEVAYDNNLVVTLEFTDKEGDVSDSLYVIRQRTNARGRLVTQPSDYKIPSFPDRNQGEFEVNLNYLVGLTTGITSLRIPGSNPSRYENDTLILKFVAKDRAGNFSDTVMVDNIIVERR